MLTLTLQGKIIPLSLDFSMRLTWKSAATDFEKIPGGYGLGLSFPVNEHTRALFGNPERFAKYRQGNDQKFSGFEARFSGLLLMAGTLSVTSFSGGNYEASLTDEIGVLGENEREQNILTFPAFTKEIPWENSSNYDTYVHPYCCFPVVNTKFFREKGVTVTIPAVGYKPSYETEALTYAFMKTPVLAKVNALNEDHTVNCIAAEFEISKYYNIPVISVVSPFFFLHKIIKEALKSVKWYVDKNVLSDLDQLKRLCIYNNFDLTNNETYTIDAEISVVRDDGYGGTNVEYVGYQISKYKRSYLETLKTKDHLPNMKLGTLLLSTQNFVNVCFDFLPDNTVNIFSRDQLLTGPSTDLDQYFIGVWYIGEKKNVALNFTHNQDGNDLIFSERFQDIEDRRADIKEPVADWDALMAIIDQKEGDIRYVKSSNNYMEFKMITVDGQTQKDILGWAEYSIGYQNGWFNKSRNEVEEIKTEWSTCYGNELYMFASQQGNMNTWKAKSQAFSPRLLIYKGNNTGGNESETLSLDYEKPGKGILPTFWKYWAPFWANRLPVTGSFDLPVNVLRHLIYNICKKYRTREGEFMIEEMSCDIYVDRIGETEIKGFKVE